jgi:hypothetical protein
VGFFQVGGENMGNRAKAFPNARRVYFKPEIRNCPHCGAKVRYDHPTSRKFVITLTETIYAVNQGYRCPQTTCPNHRTYFRSAAGEALSLKNHSYGMDVLAEIGYLRFHEYCMCFVKKNSLVLSSEFPWSNHREFPGAIMRNSLV